MDGTSKIPSIKLLSCFLGLLYLYDMIGSMLIVFDAAYWFRAMYFFWSLILLCNQSHVIETIVIFSPVVINILIYFFCLFIHSCFFFIKRRNYIQKTYLIYIKGKAYRMFFLSNGIKCLLTPLKCLFADLDAASKNSEAHIV